MAVRVPTLDAWDQFVWPPSAAIPWAAMGVEQYSYHHGNAVDLSPVMLAMDFRVTNEEGAYLCAAWALIFEGSILAYNPARDEAECIPQEADHITELRTHCLLGWSDDSSLEEEDDEQMQEEYGKPEGDEHEEAEGWGEAEPEPPSSGMAFTQGETELEVEP